ncbi:MAG: NADH-quinone oxidoreductase subunit A [Gammaproteobacteria bacterium]
MFDEYLPIALFLIISFGFACIPLGMGWLLGAKKANPAKNAPYECGFDAFNDARLKFDVRFYVIAILFIIFDLELAFLIPWSVVLRDLGSLGFWGMMFFLFLLLVGFVYEWKKGALEWE